MGQAKRIWEAQRERLLDLFFDGSMGDVEFTELALDLDFTLDEIGEIIAEREADQ